MSQDSGKKIWNLKLPPKTKNFLWRALTGCLPTKEHLLCTRVAVTALCPVCNNEQETAIHSLVSCRFARLCWTHSGYMVNIQNFTSFTHWMNMAIEIFTGEELKLIGMICWSIWNNRNEIVWNPKREESGQVVESAKLILNQWKSAQDRSFDNYIGFMTQADGQRALGTSVKINTDAALCTDSDHTGEMIEAVSSCRKGYIDPEIAEAIGIGRH